MNMAKNVEPEKRSASLVTIIDPGVSVVQWIGGLKAIWAIGAGH